MSQDRDFPAFPVPHDAYLLGMTLRDWFAGQAIVGKVLYGAGVVMEETLLARNAYAVADAMLAQRNLTPAEQEADKIGS